MQVNSYPFTRRRKRAHESSTARTPIHGSQVTHVCRRSWVGGVVVVGLIAAYLLPSRRVASVLHGASPSGGPKSCGPTGAAAGATSASTRRAYRRPPAPARRSRARSARGRTATAAGPDVLAPWRDPETVHSFQLQYRLDSETEQTY